VNRIKINKTVADELKHIPQGSEFQNMLRATYHNTRKQELGKNGETPAKNTFLRAVQAVREKDEKFTPDYDKEFFGA
jgi:hypothetical protein